MNLADMLSFADIQQLDRIARYYECECSSNSKNDLIQSILSKIYRKDVFEESLQNLSVEDLRFINTVIFEKREAFSLEDLMARVKNTRFAEENDEKLNPRETITTFKKRGWLFNGVSHKTKYLFQFPEDLKKRFMDMISKKFQQQIEHIQEPDIYRDEFNLIIQDIYLFLKELYHMQEVHLTASGTLYKRSLFQFLNQLSIQENPIQKGEWRFGYGRKFKDYPNRFSLIYDYCYFNKLIKEENETLKCTDKGRDIVENEKKENLENVYRFWIRLYKGPIHNIQSIVHWTSILAQNWVTVSSLKEVLNDYIKPYYYDNIDSILEERVLKMMMHLGLLKIGEHEIKGTVIQMTKVGTLIIRGIHINEEDTIIIPVEQN
ncbi:hypothetical protein [Chengkuizengella axinellae]|uniref:Uncharacterized protein n=1 Tax=Chengkuizengella axinellae TaxID=3064388 RepID=A0ABT9IWS5_9BACL|nr:hypothetical protein [Chengkuizengella sp. 2205SS18-9]MDP5273819.1 hypothetical protein [Chengkuizengella sp. 2205SS18-9]